MSAEVDLDEISVVQTRIRQQATYFGAFHSVVPDPKLIIKLINAFQDYGMLPSVIPEINQSDGSTANRIRLHSPETNDVLMFSGDRLFIERNMLNEQAANMHDIGAFAAHAVTMLKKAIEIVPKKSNRLSLVTDYLLKDNEKVKSKNFFSEKAVPSGKFKTNDLSEWNWRASVREENKLCGRTELINLITSINRAYGTITTTNSVIPLDTVLCQIDVNTYQGTTEDRFGEGDLDEVYSFLVGEHDDLLNNARDMICG